MKIETKAFALRTLLTVTTGRLLTKGKGHGSNGIGDLYQLLGWMTNDSPYTHQLGRFAVECKPWLYRWFPELLFGESSLEKLDEFLSFTADKSEAIQAWLDELPLLQPALKETYDVPRIPQDDHERKDPLGELAAMRPDANVVVVEVKPNAG